MSELTKLDKNRNNKTRQLRSVPNIPPDSTAREFLKSLAHKTGGRFHQAPSHTDTAATNELLSSGFSDGKDSALPEFEGDDLKKLKEETEKLRVFQRQARTFREIALTKNPEAV